MGWVYFVSENYIMWKITQIFFLFSTRIVAKNMAIHGALITVLNKQQIMVWVLTCRDVEPFQVLRTDAFKYASIVLLENFIALDITILYEKKLQRNIEEQNRNWLPHIFLNFHWMRNKFTAFSLTMANLISLSMQMMKAISAFWMKLVVALREWCQEHRSCMGISNTNILMSVSTWHWSLHHLK